MNPFPYETPSRVMRRLEAADDVELPSLPELDMFEHSGMNDSSASLSISPLPEIISRETTIVPGTFHSMPPLPPQSRLSRHSSSPTSSGDRGAASSRITVTKRGEEPREEFFEVDRIHPVPSAQDIASLLVDGPSLLEESMELSLGSIPGLPGEQNLSLEDALEAVSLSNSRKSPSPVSEPEVSIDVCYVVALRIEHLVVIDSFRSFTQLHLRIQTKTHAASSRGLPEYSKLPIQQFAEKQYESSLCLASDTKEHSVSSYPQWGCRRDTYA